MARKTTWPADSSKNTPAQITPLTPHPPAMTWTGFHDSGYRYFCQNNFFPRAPQSSKEERPAQLLQFSHFYLTAAATTIKLISSFV
jgi:hypothetical protein